jgi:hypothetical protein
MTYEVQQFDLSVKRALATDKIMAEVGGHSAIIMGDASCGGLYARCG